MDGSERKGASIVLVVDDQQDVRRVADRWLRREGFAVEEAGSGEEALALLDRVTPHVVLLDIEMPGMGGIATLDEIVRRHPGLTVVMLSGQAEEGTTGACEARGAAGFLEKPFHREDLLAALRGARAGRLDR